MDFTKPSTSSQPDSGSGQTSDEAAKPSGASLSEINAELKQNYEQAMNHISSQQFEEAISLFETNVQKAVEAYGEESYEITVHYYRLGSALLAKIENSRDVFGAGMANNKEGEDEDEDEADAAKETSNTQTSKQAPRVLIEGQELRSNVEIESETEEQEQEKLAQADQINITQSTSNSQAQPQPSKPTAEAAKETAEEDPEDIQLAWEHLEIARVFTEKKLNQVQQESNLEEMSKTMHFLAGIRSKLGDANCYRENFKEALVDYENSLSLRKFNEDPLYSRDIAGTYYLIGQAHLYMNSKECDEIALVNFHKARIILENLLNRELNMQGKKDPENNEDHKSPLLRKEFLSPNIFEKNETKELKSILLDLYNKVEDTTQQLSERDQVQKEIEKVKAQQEQTRQLESSFGKPILGQPQQQSGPELPSTFNFGLFNTASASGSNVGQAQAQEPPKLVKLGVFGNAAKKKRDEGAITTPATNGENKTSAPENKEGVAPPTTEEKKKVENADGKVTKSDELGKPEKMVKTN